MTVIMLTLASVILKNPHLYFKTLLFSELTSLSQIKDGVDYMSATWRELCACRRFPKWIAMSFTELSILPSLAKKC